MKKFSKFLSELFTTDVGRKLLAIVVAALVVAFININ